MCIRRRRSGSPDNALEVTYGGTWTDLDNHAVAFLGGGILSSYSGPSRGVAELDVCENMFTCLMENYKSYSYGISLSLYEKAPRSSPRLSRSSDSCSSSDSSFSSRKPPLVGDPVADVFGVIARKNSAILALADGVSWGPKPKLAAMCAVYASLQHLNTNISSITNTHMAFSLLWESFQRAHALIMDKNATLTTLSAAFVCELQNTNQWGLCVVGLGDSPVFVYSPSSKKLVEVTIGCHPKSDRDISDCGGVLGPGNGAQPDYANLTFATTTVSPGDYVFIVSDGIADNFHPGIISPIFSNERKMKLVPAQEQVINNMKKEIAWLENSTPDFTAQDLCACLMNFSVRMTESKRTLRESIYASGQDFRELPYANPDLHRQLNTCSGKLDHASIVAYQVGHHRPDDFIL